MSEYSVVVATFLRPTKLERTLRHLERVAEPPSQVVVVDDGGDLAESDRVYEAFDDRLPLDVVHLGFDEGLAAKRNAGIARTSTEFVLLLDDDQYVPSNVHELVEVLRANPGLGGIAPFWVEDGRIRSNAADYRLKRDWLLKGVWDDRAPEPTGTGGVMFRYDHIPNAAVFRRAVFDEYGWDEGYVIEGEDTDFYLTHARRGRWRFAVTPNYVLTHDPGPGSVERYAAERKDVGKRNASFDRLREKFGVEGVFQVGSHLPPERSPGERALLLLARHAVPYRLLWWLRRRRLWDELRELSGV